MRTKLTAIWVLLVGLLLPATAAANFHLYQINQLYTNSDGSVQYVMLREGFGANGENLLGGQSLTFTGGGSTTRFTFPTNLPSSQTANTYVLIATQGFADLNIVKPDYIVPAGFLSPSGGTLNYASVDSVTFASLPTNGTSALSRSGSVIAASPTNFAGQTGTLAPNFQPQNGWWWNANESGRGFFVEIQGATLAMAGYLYTSAGKPYWFISAGTFANNRYTGSMDNYAGGQTLTGAYMSPTLTASPGTVTLVFTSATTATLTWPGGSVPLTRNVFGGAGVGFPENGWWWNPAESGRGFSLEIQGNTMVLAGYMYDANGDPMWYLSAGPMTATMTGGGYGGETMTAWSYSGALQQYANGQAMGAPYMAPTLVSGNVGTVKIMFSDTQNAVMTLPDGRQIPFTRLLF